MTRPLLTLVVAVLLAACVGHTTPSGSLASASASASVDPADVTGAWQLASGATDAGPVPVVAGSPITLTVEGTQVGGRSACNSYFGRLVADSGGPRITEIGMTDMACAEPAMASETAYLAALALVRRIRIVGEELVLDGPGVELRFVAVAAPPTSDLLDLSWILESLFVGDVARPPVGEPARLELNSDGSFTGSTGCRSFSGTWIEDGGEILATNLAMDEVECAAALSAQDEHIVSVLEGGFVATAGDGLLTLAEPGGIGLVYRAAE